MWLQYWWMFVFLWDEMDILYRPQQLVNDVLYWTTSQQQLQLLMYSTVCNTHFNMCTMNIDYSIRMTTNYVLVQVVQGLLHHETLQSNFKRTNRSLVLNDNFYFFIYIYIYIYIHVYIYSNIFVNSWVPNENQTSNLLNSGEITSQLLGLTWQH